MDIQTKELLDKVKESGVNIVTCGDCGAVLIHDIHAGEISCSECGMTSEPCDFPDAFI